MPVVTMSAPKYHFRQRGSGPGGGKETRYPGQRAIGSGLFGAGAGGTIGGIAVGDVVRRSRELIGGPLVAAEGFTTTPSPGYYGRSYHGFSYNGSGYYGADYRSSCDRSGYNPLGCYGYRN